MYRLLCQSRTLSLFRCLGQSSSSSSPPSLSSGTSSSRLRAPNCTDRKGLDWSRLGRSSPSSSSSWPGFRLEAAAAVPPLPPPTPSSEATLDDSRRGAPSVDVVVWTLFREEEAIGGRAQTFANALSAAAADATLKGRGRRGLRAGERVVGAAAAVAVARCKFRGRPRHASTQPLPRAGSRNLALGPMLFASVVARGNKCLLGRAGGYSPLLASTQC